MTSFWRNPLPDLTLQPTDDPLSFQAMPTATTGLPLPPLHPGSYGFRRKHHVHEGVDLYCPPGTAVHAVEDCEVVAIENFTGPKAGTPWWHDTKAVLALGESGVVLYGEIEPIQALSVGTKLRAEELIGRVVTVLTKDKGRPMSMLHLELHTPDIRRSFEWAVSGEKPPSLRDPTPFLMTAARPVP